MKKGKVPDKDELRAEYKRSDFVEGGQAFLIVVIVDNRIWPGSDQAN